MLTFIDKNCIVESKHFNKVQYNYNTQSVENRAFLKIDAIVRSRIRRGRYHMVIGFTTTYANSSYHH